MCHILIRLKYVCLQEIVRVATGVVYITCCVWISALLHEVDIHDINCT